MTLLKVSFSIMITMTCGLTGDGGGVAGEAARMTRRGAGGWVVRGRDGVTGAAEAAVLGMGRVGDDVVVGGNVAAGPGVVVVAAVVPPVETDLGGTVGAKAR